MYLIIKFKIYYQNFRGLRTKTNDLKIASIICDYDIIVGSESWLDDNINDSEFISDKFTVYRRDRYSSVMRPKKGGGVFIAVSKVLFSKRLTNFESPIEDLWVSIKKHPHDTNDFILCAVYIPPPVTTNLLNLFVDNCNGILQSYHGNTMIIGDFNLPFLNWQTKTNQDVHELIPTNFNCNLGYIFVDFISLNNLTQFNDVLNTNNRILDLVLSNINNISVKVCENPLIKLDAHHPALEINTNVYAKCQPKITQKPFATHNFKKADYSIVNKELGLIDWVKEISTIEDIDSALAKFYDVLRSVIDMTIPLSIPRNLNFPSWFSRNLIRLIKEKDKIRKKYKIYNNPRDQLELKLANKRVKLLIKSCYNEYITNVEISLKKSPKNFWSFIKQQKGKNSNIPSEVYLDNKIAHSGDDICNLFASHFSSIYSPNDDRIDTNITCTKHFPQCILNKIKIRENDIVKVLKSIDISKGAGPDGIPPIFIKKTYRHLSLPLKILFEKSLQCSQFPSYWKHANVVPIHKKGDKENVKNYRPISILSHFSKIFEKIVYPVINNHFKTFLSDFQHGFSLNKSTTTNLLTYLTDLTEAVDKKVQVDSIYTDFSNAFDKVCHEILLRKLKHYGVTDNLLKWFTSYLENRTHTVTSMGYKSYVFSPTSGVPQGSHLGPILFLIFINDISDYIKNSNFLMFADDLKIYRTIKSLDDTLLLQSDIDSIYKWCSLNKMHLNIQKCSQIRFSRNKQLILSNYSIADEPLANCVSLKDLGVVLDDKLSLVEHINSIATHSWKLLGFLKRTCKDFVKPQSFIVLFNALIRSKLEYASVIWNPHYKIHTDRLERIQRNFTRFLAFKDKSCPRHTDYNTRLQHYNIQSLECRRYVSDILTLYKIVHGQIICPQILSQINLTVPRILPRYPISNSFSTSFSRTNLGKYSPLNRLKETFNAIQSQGTIDIYQQNKKQFVSDIKRILFNCY